MGMIQVQGLWEDYPIKSRRGWRRHGQASWALQDVTFDVGPGELVGVIGRNGSGKSSLLQCVSGVLRPTRGSVITEGRISSLVDPAAGFNRELTGRENTLIAAVLMGMSRSEAKKTYQRIREFSELDPATMGTPIRTYSQGMILRIGFALAVESDPDVLLVDEVLSVGDESFQQRCHRRIDELRGSGTSVLLVSHDLDVIERRSERVIVLDAGRIVFEGDPVQAVSYYVRSVPADVALEPHGSS